MTGGFKEHKNLPPTYALTNPSTFATYISTPPRMDDRGKYRIDPGDEPVPEPTTPSRDGVQTASNNEDDRGSLQIDHPANRQQTPVVSEFPYQMGVQISLQPPLRLPGDHSKRNMDTGGMEGAIFCDSTSTTRARHHGSPMV